MTVSIGDPDPRLLDVVRWDYGFVHTWALGWLLKQPETARRILAIASDFALAPGETVDDVVPEGASGRRRTDALMTIRRADGSQRFVAIETKVNDPLTDEQVGRYIAARQPPLVYLPGLTGLFHRDTPLPAGAAKLTGRQLIDTLGDLSFGPLITSYLDAVRREADAHDQALQQVAAGTEDPGTLEDAESNAVALLGSAWLVQIGRALEAQGTHAHFSPRVTAYDRGIYWDASVQPIGTDTRIYVDVVAIIGNEKREIRVKVLGPDKTPLFERTRKVPLPDGWRYARKYVKGDSATLIVADHTTADLEATNRAMGQALTFIENVTAIAPPTPAGDH